MHSSSQQPRDLLGRPIRDLRISVTDRCNFRCVYCMPREVFGPGFEFLRRSQILTYEEIERLACVFAGLGVVKLRITGGEPLVRRDVEHLVARLVAVPGVEDVAMTTNGALLAGKAEALRAAGLRRVTISLDSLDDAVFRAMNDVDFPVARRARGDRRGRLGRPRGEGERRHQARAERRRRDRAWPSTSGAPATSCG